MYNAVKFILLRSVCVLSLWSLLFSCSYKYADKSTIGPEVVPVCATFAEAKAQHQRIEARRVKLQTAALEDLAAFNEQELERRILEEDEQFQEEEATEKAEEEETMVSQVQSHFLSMEYEVQSSYIDLFLFLQAKERGIEPATPLTLRDRAKRYERHADDADTRRKQLPLVSGAAVNEAEEDVAQFMREKFTEYVPLRHHLPRFKAKQYLDLHSKEVPASEKNLTMGYTGGEQTEESLKERFKDCLRESTCAREKEEDLECDEQKLL